MTATLALMRKEWTVLFASPVAYFVLTMVALLTSITFFEHLRLYNHQLFLYASSSSIYGVQDRPRVVEDTTPLPLTDYSRFKLQCEQILLERCVGQEMTPVIVRPGCRRSANPTPLRGA